MAALVVMSNAFSLHTGINAFFICIIPLLANASVTRDALGQTNASSNCVKASIPQDAEVDLGQDNTSSGSTIA